MCRHEGNPSVVVAAPALLARGFVVAGLTRVRMRLAVTPQLGRLLAEVDPAVRARIVPATIHEVRFAPLVLHVRALIDTWRRALHAYDGIGEEPVRRDGRRCYGCGATCCTDTSESGQGPCGQCASNS